MSDGLDDFDDFVIVGTKLPSQDYGDDESIDAGWNVINIKPAPLVSKKSDLYGKVKKQQDKVKASFYNIYQNIPSETPRLLEDDIWFLGVRYSLRSFFDQEYDHKKRRQKPHAELFIEEIETSLFYFTYRTEFEEIIPYRTRNDIGWGCMIRCGQMILGKAIINKFLGHGWRFTSHELNYSTSSDYRQILRWFSDSPNLPYSIHSIIDTNIELHGLDKKDINGGGEWFSPTKISRVLQYLVNEHNLGIKMHVPLDNVVYTDELLDNDIEWLPLFLLISTRLGVNNINPKYIDHVKQILRCPYSVGIIGGKPKESYYFVAYQGDDLLYLDPHFVQKAFTVEMTITEKMDSTFHCRAPLRMPIIDIDPSLAVGFYFETKDEFVDFIDTEEQLLSMNDYLPIFTFGEQC